MSLAVFLKNNLTNIPPYIGQEINKITYDYRHGIGSVYRIRKTEIADYDASTTEERQLFIFKRLKALVDFAYRYVPAYTAYYDSEGFYPDLLSCFEDINKIPLTSKSILNKYTIEERSFQKKGRYIVNREALRGLLSAFILNQVLWGMSGHNCIPIWNKLDFKVSDLKLGFGGRSNIKDIVDYDVVRIPLHWSVCRL